MRLITFSSSADQAEVSISVGLLDLLDRAVEQGWSTRRACAALGLDDLRAARWVARREGWRAGGSAAAWASVARRPGLGAGPAAVVKLFESWAEVDRSH
jgi:aryl carrier-like protein